MTTLAPTPASERIFALDTIRGFAVLGILLMNILGMGLSMPGYLIPSTQIGGMTGWNFWAWVAEMFYFEGTMRGLFTLLFGAGIVLYTSRLERAGAGARTADLYFRRNLWLIVFGLFNGWILLWQGDILFFYGMTALFLFVFRNLPIRKLLLCSALLMCAQPIGGTIRYFNFEAGQREASVLLALQASKASMTAGQQAKLEVYEGWTHFIGPDARAIAEESRRMRGSYGSAAAEVREHVAKGEGEHFFAMAPGASGLWESAAMMLLGMALFKSGALTLGWSTRAYMLLLVLGYGIGLGVNAWEISYITSHDFSPLSVLVPWSLTYDYGRIPVTLGHVALAMLVVRSGMFRGILSRLAATGRWR